MRNKIYAKNTEYIACRKNLSKNLHFRKTFVYLSVSGNPTRPPQPQNNSQTFVTRHIFSCPNNGNNGVAIKSL